MNIAFSTFTSTIYEYDIWIFIILLFLVLNFCSFFDCRDYSLIKDSVVAVA